MNAPREPIPGLGDASVTWLVAAPFANAEALVYDNLARVMAPRRPLSMSEWADKHFSLSSKGSAKTGQWRTSNNPPLKEPLDSMSARSGVHDIVLKFPIQFGKTMVAVIAVGYSMEHQPGPIMVVLPSEILQKKWVDQKLNPMLEEVPVVRALLASTASRDGANRREFKDFEGGQLYIEHAGSPGRLKQTSVRTLIVDEWSEFATALLSGDDPGSLVDGRTSAFPTTYKRLKISTPGLVGLCRTTQDYEASDQRTYHVPCPTCGEYQPLRWAGLHWGPGGTDVHYLCGVNGCRIDEHHKTDMIRRGRWVAKYPERKRRGYTINCLYYQFDLGPRWAALVEMWLDAQNDQARLKTFINDRLAEAWEDPAMRAVKHNAIADRAEPYSLRTAPEGVLAITAGVDTQDNRIAVHITGWGRGMASWAIDYVELHGDPAEGKVWCDLVELLQRPVEHASGAALTVEATAIDMGGHRTEEVKAFVAARRITRPLCIYGATSNNAPPLARGKPADLKRNGRVEKKGVLTHQVGTVAIKHWFYGRLSVDAAREKPEDRQTHFSNELDTFYFQGITSETFDPRKNRFEKKRGARNEPLDTYTYSNAAAHHPELRLHRATKLDWDARAARIAHLAAQRQASAANPAAPKPAAALPPPTPAAAPAPSSIASSDWSSRL